MSAGSRERIEAVAAELLARDGYNGMGLKALSDAAGLPYGSIYHHFPGGKEEIAVAAITSMSAVVGSLVERLFADGVTDRTIRILFRYMADQLERSDWSVGCTIGTPALDGSADSEAVRAACEAGFAALIDPTAAALRQQGYTRAAARDLATTIFSTYEGATILARAQHSKAPLRTAGESMIHLLGLGA